ncbi:serine/threonine-protein kinase [Jongsikchunia kroppenstedtii]|uniref:serine/threonine-protein kinase n=1 Tax=Jongsikchunia kroppenstedtii TaxID=1121721 RepID=UPI0003AA6E42|nr:serine/threonine-protein kinase [Jongsikchunia kroppenstedtii]
MTETSSSQPPRPVGPDYLVAGRYRLRSMIGGGGMGAVWLAHDQLLDREIAIKQVISTVGMTESTAEEMRQRALREGRIAARLSHRNAIAMHDVALEAGEPWLVMEYLPSQSLAQILDLTGPIPTTQAAQLGAQVADAMAEGHEVGIIHRDIKPGNILIADTGRNAGIVKITDFGISRARGDVQLTQTGVITGTPAYFSPEVARGEEPTEASDVYSLGSTLYTAVEGTPPFGIDENSLVLLHRVAAGNINPPRQAGELGPILRQMLDPDPAARPTMTQIRDRLAVIAAGESGNTATVLTAPLTVGTMPIRNYPSAATTRAHTPAPPPAPQYSVPPQPIRTTQWPHTSMVSAPEWQSGPESAGPTSYPSYPPRDVPAHGYSSSPKVLAAAILAVFIALSVLALVLIGTLR